MKKFNSVQKTIQTVLVCIKNWLGNDYKNVKLSKEKIKVRKIF